MNDWKQSLKGNRGSCSDEIRDFLDLHMPGWRHTSRAKSSVSSISSGDSDDDDMFLVEKEKKTCSDCQDTTPLTAGDSVKEYHADVSCADTAGFVSCAAGSAVGATTAATTDTSTFMGKRKRKLEAVIHDEDDDEAEVMKQIIRDSELLLSLSSSWYGLVSI